MTHSIYEIMIARRLLFVIALQFAASTALAQSAGLSVQRIWGSSDFESGRRDQVEAASRHPIIVHPFSMAAL